MSRSAQGLLPQISFNILLALSLEPRHGYELMEQIAADSGGRLKPGPGALYGNLRKLSEDNVIEEVPFLGNERRRHYRLTKKGWDLLGKELKYYDRSLRLARQRNAL